MAHYAMCTETITTSYNKSSSCLKISWRKAIKNAHEETVHMGAQNTVNRVRLHFFFPGTIREAIEVTQNCVDCQRRAGKNQDQRHTLKSHMDGHPLQKLSMNFEDPLPKSSKGNEYSLTVQNTFTRWLEAFPVKRATAGVMVKILTLELFPQFGTCEQIHTGSGTQLSANS